MDPILFCDAHYALPLLAFIHAVLRAPCEANNVPRHLHYTVSLRVFHNNVFFILPVPSHTTVTGVVSTLSHYVRPLCALRRMHVRVRSIFAHKTEYVY